MKYTIDKKSISLFDNEKNVAYVTLRWESETVVCLDKVFVDPELRGQGIAAQIMEYTATHFSQKGITMKPVCSYAHIWLKRHPQFDDSVIFVQEHPACHL